ncbi:MAG: ATP-binding protein [Desulfobulbaceae bacterium]|nr:ATP-binding protein [Desulfobulbaceae bacterium]
MTVASQPTLFAFFGLIASGKSTLGQAFAEKNRFAYHNSDVVRKELAGAEGAAGRSAEFDGGIYSAEFTEQTYSALLSRAESDLAAGKSVVLDASYQSPHERDRVRKLAERLAVPLYFVLCICPEEEMKRRMEQRARDPLAVSDGRWEIYLEQKERYRPPAELAPGTLLTIETMGPVASLVTRLEEMLASVKAGRQNG